MIDEKELEELKAFMAEHGLTQRSDELQEVVEDAMDAKAAYLGAVGGDASLRFLLEHLSLEQIKNELLEKIEAFLGAEDGEDDDFDDEDDEEEDLNDE